MLGRVLLAINMPANSLQVFGLDGLLIGGDEFIDPIPQLSISGQLSFTLSDRVDILTTRELK